MNYPNISVQVICKNEERVIERCLKAITDQLRDNDEIIIVDTGSTDKTKGIIKEKFPQASLFDFVWKEDFAEARNFAILQSKKDWIFFVDSDEVLQRGSLLNLRKNIIEVEKVSNEPIVFSPKVLNKNDTIVYNAGRIIKNTGVFKFYGCVHEYPIYLDDLTGKNYVTLRVSNVKLVHDGYQEEIVVNKNKVIRNTELEIKMLEKFPDNDRYYYFYYRDAKSILGDKDYELALKKFIILYPNSSFLTQVYSDLISYLISKRFTSEAEIYIQKYYQILSLEKNSSKTDVIRLSVLNELQKINEIQKELLNIMIRTKEDLYKDDYRLIEHGYVLDDIIGYLYWNLGELKTAKKIYSTLKENNYLGMLDRLFTLQNEKNHI